MNIKLFLVVAVLLAGCEPDATQYSPVPSSILPDGLKDCTFYRVSPAQGPTMSVARCPISSTTTTIHSKYPVVTATIDGTTADASAEAQHKVDEILSRIDADIVRLEQLKKEIR